MIKKIITVSILLLSVALSLYGGAETLCYTQRITDAPTFNIYTGRNDANNPIKWTHSVPEGILDRVVRVGLYIEAYDVDYPLNDEHDRVYFNGHDLGLLEGLNNSWITVEKTVPISAIRTGINDLKVVVDELGKTWKVTIRASELRFYCDSAEPDFSIGVTPAQAEVTVGSSIDFNLELLALNKFDSEVTLSTGSLPNGISAQFTQNPVVPDATSTLTLSVGDQSVPGTHTISVTGSGGGKTHSREIKLLVKGKETEFLPVVTNRFDKSEAVPGDIVTITVKIENDAKNILEDSEISSKISEHLSYIDDDSGVPFRLNNGRYFWNISALDPGMQKQFKIRLKVKDDGYSGQVSSTFLLKEIESGKEVTSNVAQLLLKKIDLELLKRVDKSEAKPSDELSYTLQISNNSSVALTDLRIEDTLSDELEFLSQEGSGIFNRDSSKLSWELTLAPGEKRILKINTRIKPTVMAGTTIFNLFSASTAQLTGPVVSNQVATKVNSDSIQISNVKFRKRTVNRQTQVGRTVSFRFEIENRSKGVLLSPVIKDYLPQGFAYVSGSSVLNGQSLNDPSGSSVLRWLLPDISAGASVVLRFQTVIGADTKRGKNINRGTLDTRDTSGKSIRLESSDFINVSISGFIFYSGLEGTVFIDRNRDGFFGIGDTPLKGIEIRLSTGEKTVSNQRGEYSFKELYPGDYAVGVNRMTLPSKYKLSTASPVITSLFDGLTDVKDFALIFRGEDPKFTCRLEGIVFIDKNNNGSYDNGEPMAEDGEALIDNKNRSRVKKGVFKFTHLKKGKHDIRIKYGNQHMNQTINLTKKKNRIYFPIKFSGITITIGSEK